MIWSLEVRAPASIQGPCLALARDDAVSPRWIFTIELSRSWRRRSPILHDQKWPGPENPDSWITELITPSAPRLSYADSRYADSREILYLEQYFRSVRDCHLPQPPSRWLAFNATRWFRLRAPISPSKIEAPVVRIRVCAIQTICEGYG